MSKFLSPIVPKITEADAVKLAKDKSAHYGANPDFALTFQLLAGLSVFADRKKFRTFIEAELDRDDIEPLSPSDRKFIPERFACHHLYQEAYDPYHYREWRGPRKKQWCEKRMSNLLTGRKSFLHAEGDYFYEGLRLGFGDDWAAATTAQEFVTSRIDEFITARTRDGLIVPWGRFDPITSFRLLYEQYDKVGIDRPLKIIPVGSTRPSRKRVGEIKNISLQTAERQLYRGEKFQLQIRNVDPDEHHLVIEFSEDGYTVNNGPKLFRGEVMPFREHIENRIVVQGEDGEPFQIEQPPGRYGFLVISGYDIQDLIIEADIAEGEEHLTDAQLRKLASTFRTMSHRAGGADLSLGIIDYSVSA